MKFANSVYDVTTLLGAHSEYSFQIASIEATWLESLCTSLAHQAVLVQRGSGVVIGTTRLAIASLSDFGDQGLVLDSGSSRKLGTQPMTELELAKSNLS